MTNKNRQVKLSFSGHDPGSQSVFNFQTKETKKICSLSEKYRPFSEDAVDIRIIVPQTDLAGTQLFSVINTWCNSLSVRISTTNRD